MLANGCMERLDFLVDHAKLEKKAYQYDGIRWCVENECNEIPLYSNVRGGIIADEMGLGKTFTMIGTMFANMLPCTLIVVPPILLDQWYQEIFRISGHKALIYHGITKKTITIEQLARSRIVITTYGAISISRKKLELDKIHKVLWNRVVFDEAHHLRNRKTTRFLGCTNIRATIRWFMTGTPIQNKRTDLYHLLSALGLPKSVYIVAIAVPAVLKQYVLRRTKKSVGLQMPDVVEATILVPWSNSFEKKVAEEIHSAVPVSLVSHKKSGLFSNVLRQGKALTAILRAKQICIMPSLLKPLIESLVLKKSVTEDYTRMLENHSKVDAVVSCIVAKKDNGKGKIVFCHYHNEIDLIAQQLTANGITTSVFDGRNKGVERWNKLKENTTVLILQIQTGCEGLNLQENYSEVYFVSPHWNPSIEDQAIARCHRMGQLNDVKVFRFIMDSFEKEKESTMDPITLEKYIHMVQEMKRKMYAETFAFLV